MTEPAMPPVPPGENSWEDVYREYQRHIREESEWLREMNRQRASWERSTLARQKLLQPYWDWQSAEKFPEDRP